MVEIPKEKEMVMARKREKKEKDIIDQLLDNIDFRGLTQDEVVGQNGLIKQFISVQNKSPYHTNSG